MPDPTNFGKALSGNVIASVSDRNMQGVLTLASPAVATRAFGNRGRTTARLGLSSIEGVAMINGAPGAGANILLLHSTGHVADMVRADSNGAYAFRRVNAQTPYAIVVVDPAGSYRAKVIHTLTPVRPIEVTLGYSAVSAFIGEPYYSGAPVLSAAADPVTWTYSGTIPTDLTFNTLTGEVSGVGDTPGQYPLIVTGTDSTGRTIQIELPLALLEVAAGVNVALNKTVIPSAAVVQNTTAVITDGAVPAATGSSYCGVGSTAGLVNVTVDLGWAHNIGRIEVFHYPDGRIYNQTKTEVSVDGVAWDVVFDSAVQGTYPDTLDGKVHTFTQRKVRYIRDWVNGSNLNTGNHWVEIRAMRTV